MRGSDCAAIVNPEGMAWPGAWDYNPKDKLHKDSDPQTTLQNCNYDACAVVGRNQTLPLMVNNLLPFAEGTKCASDYYNGMQGTILATTSTLNPSL